MHRITALTPTPLLRMPIRKAGVNHKALKVIGHIIKNQPEQLNKFLDAYKNSRKRAGTAVEPISNFLDAQVSALLTIRRTLGIQF